MLSFRQKALRYLILFIIFVCRRKNIKSSLLTYLIKKTKAFRFFDLLFFI